MVLCFLKSCSNRSDSQGWKKHINTNKKISFHRFPRNPKICKRWLDILEVDVSSVSSTARICSDHFNEESFDRTGSIVRLRRSALPNYVPASTMDGSMDQLRPVQIKTEVPFEEAMETEETVESEEIVSSPSEGHTVGNHCLNYRNEAPINVNFDRNSSIVASTSIGEKATTNRPLRRNSIHRNVKQNLPATLPPNALGIDLKEKVSKTHGKGDKTKSVHDDGINDMNNIDTENTAAYYDTIPQIKQEIKEEAIDDTFYFETNENQFVVEDNEVGKWDSEDRKSIDVSSSVATDILVNAHSACSVCNKSFPTELFAAHECVNKDFNFVCVKSENQQKSDSRVEYSNDGHDSVLLCFSCKEVFESADLLKSHRLVCMSVKPELVYNASKSTCGFCEKTFESETELKKHTSKTHFWCNICFSLWKTADIGEMHNRESHKKHYCEACKCYFDTVKQLTYHEHKTLHNKLVPAVEIDKPFVCDRCSARFDLKYKLIEHKNGCNTVAKRPVEICCKVCSKKFDIRYMYLRHVQSKCETQFKCRFYCNRVFGTFESLEKHIRTHHKEEILWCRLCHLTFKEKVSLDRHLCVALQCKICLEMFLKKDFNRHKCFECK